ncbi:hypothetical protein JS532_06550 [Bifidobacterium callimiconis]|uniref:hypothetical protein n=1 Tax=Bifidobacterium callimiconis TaxID=2306973 RepID=UPI001BDBB483|nr:hypothetical protein [Bifidobacterium callimiconis]MBT1177223.1 hypothetical protein [Bifidobacterium callimiconis]
MFLVLIGALACIAAAVLTLGLRLMHTKTKIPVYPLGLALAVVGGVATVAFVAIFLVYGISALV